MVEYVDILTPPLFHKSGNTKTREQAVIDRDRVGTFNLRIIQTQPHPAIVYQVRSPQKKRAPGKLDVSAGGFYMAGEEYVDGLREAKEELGKDYSPEQLTYVGKKLYVGDELGGGRRNNVIDISILIDNSALDTYILKPDEVYGICSIPLDELERIHTKPGYSFEVEILLRDGSTSKKSVVTESFPENRDNYHYKMVRCIKQFLEGKEGVMY